MPVQCNEVAQQFIGAFSGQVFFLAGWTIAALGGLLGATFAIMLHNAGNPTKYVGVTYWPLWLSIGFLAVSLLSSYWAINALTQSIPAICAHAFSDSEQSLREVSNTYRIGIYVMRFQYFSFLIGVAFAIALIFFNRSLINTKAPA